MSECVNVYECGSWSEHVWMRGACEWLHECGGGEGVYHVCDCALVCGCVYEGSVCMDEYVEV